MLKSVRGKGYFLQEKPTSATKRPFPVVMHSASHAFGSIKLSEGDLIVITKVTSTQTGSDNEGEQNGFPGGGSGFPGGNVFVASHP